MSEEVRKRWPGNQTIKFKGPGTEEAQKELQELSDQLVPVYSFHEAGFGAKAIKQHILDCVNERRRRVRNGSITN